MKCLGETKLETTRSGDYFCVCIKPFGVPKRFAFLTKAQARELSDRLWKWSMGTKFKCRHCGQQRGSERSKTSHENACPTNRKNP